MKTILILLSLFLFGCRQVEPDLAFMVTEAHEMNLKTPKPRQVFTREERQVFLVYGSTAFGQEVKVDFYRGNDLVLSTPPQRAQSDKGLWFSVKPFDPGAYHAKLFINGKPALSINFAVLP